MAYLEWAIFICSAEFWLTTPRLCLFWDVLPALLPRDTEPLEVALPLLLVLLLIGLFCFGSWLLPRLFPKVLEAFVELAAWLWPPPGKLLLLPACFGGGYDDDGGQ